MNNCGQARVFAYYLVDLLSRNKCESIDTIRHNAETGKLVDYLSENYPHDLIESLRNSYFANLNTAAKDFDFDPETYGLTETTNTNGLAILLCKIIDDML